MATDVIMPQMGFDMVEGIVVRWLKREGEEVARGEAIVEVETDKATVEVEAFGSGILRKIVIGEGQKVPVGQIIGIIASANEELPTLEGLAPVRPTIERPASAKGPVALEEGHQEEKQPGERQLVSPLARRIAEERGIDLSLVKGTGPKGRITKEDVLAFAESGIAVPSVSPLPTPQAPGQVVVTELSKMRQTIARRMTQSKQQVPHFYVTTSIDMTKAMTLRDELNHTWEKEVRVTVNDLIIKATALALSKHSAFNSYYEDGKIKRNPLINIGVAIALEDGLIAPALLDCASKNLKETALAGRDLVNRARTGVLKPQEYTDATIAISNLGMFDVDSFIAIINPLQSASLAVGSVRKQPVVKDGQIAIAEIMQATLSADHRVVNGAEAAIFLNAIKGYLEKPSSLLV